MDGSRARFQGAQRFQLLGMRRLGDDHIAGEAELPTGVLDHLLAGHTRVHSGDHRIRRYPLPAP